MLCRFVRCPSLHSFAPLRLPGEPAARCSIVARVCGGQSFEPIDLLVCASACCGETLNLRDAPTGSLTADTRLYRALYHLTSYRACLGAPPWYAPRTESDSLLVSTSISEIRPVRERFCHTRQYAACESRDKT